MSPAIYVALLACLADCLEDPAPPGQPYGPDYFNFTAFALEPMARRFPAVLALSEDIRQVTLLQERCAVALRRANFEILDCGAVFGDPSKSAKCGANLLGSSFTRGSGYVSWAAEPSLGAAGSCGDVAFWRALEGEALLALETAARSIGPDIDACHWISTLQEAVDTILKQAARVLADDAVAACTMLYHLMQVVGEYVAKMAWGAFYWEAYKAGAIGHKKVAHDCHSGKSSREVIPWLLGDELQADRGPRMAEIGVYHAETSSAWLSRVPNLSVLLVDPYQEVFDSGDPYSMYLTDPMADLVKVRKRMAAHIDSGRVAMLTAPSILASKWIENNSLDLVFIDGDHSYEATLGDIRAWAPKVRSGGVIAGHDFNPFACWGSACEEPGGSGGAEAAAAGAHPRSVAAAVAAGMPEDATLHLAPSAIWWWRA